MVKLVLISGSLRNASANSAVLRAIAWIAAGQHGVRTEYLPIHNLPFYNADVEAAEVPAAVTHARRVVAGADAVIIATPEYNGAPSGVLKNALDWLSRPYGSSALTGKPVATASAAPGSAGGESSQRELRRVLGHCDAAVIDYPPVVVAKAYDLVDAGGELSDPAVLTELENLVALVSAHCRAGELIRGSVE